MMFLPTVFVCAPEYWRIYIYVTGHATYGEKCISAPKTPLAEAGQKQGQFQLLSKGWKRDVWAATPLLLLEEHDPLPGLKEEAQQGPTNSVRSWRQIQQAAV